MIPHFAESIAELKPLINRLEKKPEVKSIIVLAADDPAMNTGALKNIFQQTRKTIIGGIFPEIIVEAERKNRGFILLPQSFTMEARLIDYNDPTLDYVDHLEEAFGNLPGDHIFVFTDALGKRKNDLIEGLFNCFGVTVSYLGGGAGSLSFQPIPCVFSNSGVHQNAAIVALASIKPSIGVAHGWSAITEPMKVTAARDNIVSEINWEPAFEIYQNIIRRHSGKEIDPDNFFSIARSYPLGLVKIDDEFIIRDPYKSEANEIHIIDRVNKGEYISVMHGNLDSLLNAAKKASEFASPLDDKNTTSSLFLIDCISRVLFMENDFQKELEIVKSKNTQVFGALTIGEIANQGNSFLEIFNKAIIVAQW